MNSMNGGIYPGMMPGQMMPGQMMPGQMMPGQMMPGQMPGMMPGMMPGTFLLTSQGVLLMRCLFWRLFTADKQFV